ncbi:MAG: DUF1003 domain-containing protein [Bacilli bacterium]|nr:DUF1003 domain-containing protein [Bacilli bacterium]
MSRKRNKEKLIRIILNQGSKDAKENYDELFELLIDEPVAINVDKDVERTLGEKFADDIAAIAGSWGFIFGFLGFLAIWMILNLVIANSPDPYPFILLNLILSCLAAIQAPIIMMSQNREAKRDRLKSTNDFKTNIKSELILEKLYDKIEDLIRNQEKILKYIDANDLEEKIENGIDEDSEEDKINKIEEKIIEMIKNSK